MYYGTTGGAADPFLSGVRQRTYTPKVDHTAEYVQLGTDMASMIGSIFLARAQGGAPAGGAGGTGGAQGGGPALNSQQIIQSYVQADQAYDTAKQNMKTAIEELGNEAQGTGLYGELKNAQNAKALVDNTNDDGTAKDTSKPALDDALKNLDTEAKAQDNEAIINAFNQVNAQFTAAQNDYKAYSDLKAADSKLQLPQLGTDGFSTDGTGHVRATGTSNTPQWSYDGYTGDVPKFEGDGGDVARANSFNPTGEDGTSLPNVKQSAVKHAQTLDAQFAERQSKADEYNGIVDQKASNKRQMDSYLAQHPDFANGAPKESDFKFEGEVGGKKNPSLSDLKGMQLGGSYNVETYSTTKERLTSERDNNKNIGTEANIKAIEDRITAKKNEIKGTLKTELTSKKNAFDIAKAAFSAMAADATSASDAQDGIAGFKAAAKSMGKHKKILGMRIGKSTQANKDYKAARDDANQQRTAFQANYGVDFSTITKQITMANAKVDAVNVNLKDSDWQNIT